MKSCEFNILAKFTLVLTRQHDDPVLLIPAGVERDGVQGQVSVRNLLPGVFTIITVLGYPQLAKVIQ